MASTHIGIPGVDSIPWGSHFCQFYDHAADLIETLVPFFSNGLGNREHCLWITGAQLPAEQAREEMLAVMPDFQRYLDRGQMAILDIGEWYTRDGGFDADAVLDGWLEREAWALEQGYAGTRLTGDTFWLERESWDDFQHYEARVTEAFTGRQLIALCTYCAGKCSASDIVDVAHTHDFALMRKGGRWRALLNTSVQLLRKERRRVERDLLMEKRRYHALREEEQRKNEFLAVLGHELRNPLAPLRAGLDLLGQAPRQPELLERLQPMMERQLSHLTRLIDDLLDVSRVSQGKITLQRTTVDLRSPIQAAIEQVSTAMTGRHHLLTVDLGEVTLPAVGDLERLTQVFANLLSNAAKYTPPGGHVHISAGREQDGVVARVRDDGYGIPPHRMETLFRLFSQVPEHREMTAGEGLGIGLALSEQIVHMHGGTLTAHSDGLGQGSEFTVRLPAGSDEQTRQQDDRSEAAAKDRRHVLIVDDNVDAAEGLAMILELKGHTTRTAHDGMTALRIWEETRPEVVLLDIGLPRMDGVEVARHIRAQPHGQHTRLIAITGWGQEGDRRRTREAQFDEHLTKPVDTARLLELIG